MLLTHHELFERIAITALGEFDELCSRLGHVALLG
jgi:hypothetical protein